MLRIYQMFVEPLATYAIHLPLESRELQESWDQLEKEFIKIVFGIYWGRRMVKLSENAKLSTLNAVEKLMMTGIMLQLRDRSESPPQINKPIGRQGVSAAKAMLKLQGRLKTSCHKQR